MTPKAESGIALLQSLFFSAIVMSLLILFVSYSDSKIQRSNLFADKVSILLESKTAETFVLASLINRDQTNFSNRFRGKFNRYGEPFHFDTVQIRLQDLAGLMTINPRFNSRLPATLMSLGYDQITAAKLTAELEDWQDSDSNEMLLGAEQAAYGDLIIVRNKPIQSVRELRYLKSAKHLDNFSDVFTLYDSGYFNPMTAPESVLAAYVSDSESIKRFVKKRMNVGVVNNDVFELLKLEITDRIMPTSGKGIRININHQKESAASSSELEYIIDPYNETPVSVFGVVQRY